MRALKVVMQYLRSMSLKAQFSVVAMFTALSSALIAASPAASLAVESETTKKVGEVATQVGSEGVEIVLIILTALIALIVAVIIIPKAVGLIKRFI